MNDRRDAPLTKGSRCDVFAWMLHDHPLGLWPMAGTVRLRRPIAMLETSKTSLLAPNS